MTSGKRSKRERYGEAPMSQPVSMAPVTTTLEVTHREIEAFQGPLPSPAVLQRFAEVVPSAPERIIAMAEREQSQRHTIEREQIRLARSATIWQLVLKSIGMAVAAGTCIALFVLAFLLANRGSYGAAAWLGTAGIAAIVVALLTGVFAGKKVPEKTE